MTEAAQLKGVHTTPKRTKNEAGGTDGDAGPMVRRGERERGLHGARRGTGWGKKVRGGTAKGECQTPFTD